MHYHYQKVLQLGQTHDYVCRVLMGSGSNEERLTIHLGKSSNAKSPYKR